MQLQVLLERVSEDTFRVSGSAPIEVSAEGATEEEALRNYREAVAARLINGGKLVSIDLEDRPETVHPWKKYAGGLPNDDLTAEWKQAIEEFRNEKDRELEDS